MSSLTAADVDALSRLGISEELAACAGLKRVTDAEARDYGFRFDGAKDLSGVIFPYCDWQTGKRVTARLRRDDPEVNADGKLQAKYLCAWGDRRHLYFPPHRLWFSDLKVPIVLVESEKSSLALFAWSERTGRKIFPIATGGCWSWRGEIGFKELPDGGHEKEKGPLPDLAVCNGRKVYVLFDSNSATNTEVQRARAALVRQLRKQRAQVQVLDLPAGPGINGPDDFLAIRGDDELIRIIEKWRQHFHTYDEIISAPAPDWLITNFAEVEDILMIGGPSGHGKSLLLLSLSRALLTGEPLFNFAQFKVPKPSERVIFLIPEVGLRSCRRRLEWFRLLPFVQSGRLFVRTLSCGPVVSLTDPLLLSAVDGSDVFLDTAIRFSEGDESSAADNRDGLAATLFGLSRAGARSVICAHHAPKDFAKQAELTLENCLRGSGDIGAMLSTAYGIRQVDKATNRILIQCIKPRDIDPLPPFEVQGRPFIADVGDFRVISEPSEKPLAERIADTATQKARILAEELFAEGKSANFVAEELKRRDLGKNRALISRWQNDFKEQQRAVSESVSKSVSPLRGRNTGNGSNGECAHPLRGMCGTLKSPSLLKTSETP